MKTATLKRWYGPSIWGTFGRLEAKGGLVVFTVERPWLNNRRNESCIPEGLYRVSHHTRPSGDDAYILQGEHVSHYEEPGVARFLVLIHPGNTAQDVVGCIAPGTYIDNSAPAVRNSRDAMAMLFDYFGADDWMLSIESHAAGKVAA